MERFALFVRIFCASVGDTSFSKNATVKTDYLGSCLLFTINLIDVGVNISIFCAEILIN